MAQRGKEMNVRVMTMALGLIIISIPAMAAGCSKLHDEYEQASGPKAFATGSNGGCGYATRKSASSLNDAKRRALALCRQNDRDCSVAEASEE
jgi:hypothetical protein